MGYRSIDIDAIREVLDIDLERAHFVWRERPREAFSSDIACKAWNAKNSGKVAGLSRNRRGYRQITIFGRSVLVHVLVYALAHGRWPKAGKMIDHIDGDISNNRPDNLRLVSGCQNACNRRTVAGCSSQFRGVSKRKYGFEACIMKAGKSKYLGLFKTEGAAALAYNAAARRYFGDYARLNEVA